MENLLKITIQVLTIFHKYSILNVKDKSNRHAQSICKKNNISLVSVAKLCKLFSEEL